MGPQQLNTLHEVLGGLDSQPWNLTLFGVEVEL
jgi:hypothetical protein